MLRARPRDRLGLDTWLWGLRVFTALEAGHAVGSQRGEQVWSIHAERRKVSRGLWWDCGASRGRWAGTWVSPGLGVFRLGQRRSQHGSGDAKGVVVSGRAPGLSTRLASSITIAPLPPSVRGRCTSRAKQSWTSVTASPGGAPGRRLPSPPPCVWKPFLGLAQDPGKKGESAWEPPESTQPWLRAGAVRLSPNLLGRFHV